MDQMNDSNETDMVSERFCAEDADVIFRSSDDVLFKLHKINLHICAKGFAPPEFESRGEIVKLTEPASVLELLFQFVYPDRLPELESLEFQALAPLAEAAEKYEVFYAMFICKLHMKGFVRSHAQEILVYSFKHGYRDVANVAAPLLISKPLAEILESLPLELAVSWAIYHERWCQVQRKACGWADPINDGYTACNLCRRGSHTRNTNHILRRLAASVDSLTKLEYTFSECDICCPRSKEMLGQWRASIAKDVEEIQGFMP